MILPARFPRHAAVDLCAQALGRPVAFAYPPAEAAENTARCLARKAAVDDYYDVLQTTIREQAARRKEAYNSMGATPPPMVPVPRPLAVW